jgi:chaperone modulatory protein CbpM
MTGNDILRGQVIGEEVLLDLVEFATLCHVEQSLLVEMIEFGLLEPTGAQRGEWRLPAREVRRARTADRLRRDLGVNVAGVAVILELIEQRDRLESRLRQFEVLLGD